MTKLTEAPDNAPEKARPPKKLKGNYDQALDDEMLLLEENKIRNEQEAKRLALEQRREKAET